MISSSSSQLSPVIIKSDRKKKLVYAEAYRPRGVDTDKEYMDFDDVEQTAHQFLLDGRTDKIDLNHNFKESGCRVVESFIARKGDPDFTPGSWVLGVKVFDDGLWARIEKGEFNGFSWGTRVDPVREREVVYKSSPIKGEGETETCGAGLLPEHSHPVVIKFDKNSKVERTFTGESLGHVHQIRKTTATDMNLDHAHRLEFVAKGDGDIYTPVPLETRESGAVVFDFGGDAANANWMKASRLARMADTGDSAAMAELKHLQATPMFFIAGVTSLKFNGNHDSLGRFSSGSDGVTGGHPEFKTPELHSAYASMSSELSGKTAPQIRKIWDKDKRFAGIKDSLFQWVVDTGTSGGLLLKELAKESERLPGSIRYSSKTDVAPDVSAVTDASQRMDLLRKGPLQGRVAGTISKPILKKTTLEDYARARALHRAYLDASLGDHGDTVTLFRGVDGDTGPKIAREFQKNKEKGLNFKEDPIVGYTTDKSVADYYGANHGGVTITREVPRADIVFHGDLFALSSEKEFVIRNTDAVCHVSKEGVSIGKVRKKLDEYDDDQEEELYPYRTMISSPDEVSLLLLKFDENQHPRAADGKWTSAGEAAGASAAHAVRTAGQVADVVHQTPIGQAAGQAAWDKSRDSVVKLADTAGPKLDSFTQTAHNANAFMAPVAGTLWAASASTALIPAVGPEIAAALAAAATTARATTLALEVLEESSKHASDLLTDLKKHANDPKSSPDELKKIGEDYVAKHAEVALKMAQIFGS